MSELYERIAVFCRDKGVSVSGMCVALGMSKSIMSDLNSGKKDGLSQKTLAKISDFLEVPVDTLIGKEKKPSENGELDEYLDMLRQRPGLRALLRVHKDSTEEEIEANVRFIEQMRRGHD